ncbi:MAG: transposase [Sandaracinaceae bacterium]|nr:transposase [Sandaracinaceae bacterium]
MRFRHRVARRAPLHDLGRKARELRCPMLAVGCGPDHVHVVVRLASSVALGDLVQRLKGASAYELNGDVSRRHPFAWQNGCWPESSVPPTSGPSLPTFSVNANTTTLPTPPSAGLPSAMRHSAGAWTDSRTAMTTKLGRSRHHWVAAQRSAPPSAADLSRGAAWTVPRDAIVRQPPGRTSRDAVRAPQGGGLRCAITIRLLPRTFRPGAPIPPGRLAVLRQPLFSRVPWFRIHGSFSPPRAARSQLVHPRRQQAEVLAAGAPEQSCVVSSTSAVAHTLRHWVVVELRPRWPPLLCREAEGLHERGRSGRSCRCVPFGRSSQPPRWTALRVMSGFRWRRRRART